MLKRLFILHLISCSSDISIITPPEKIQDDTEDIIIDETGEVSPSSEPGSEMTDLTIGFAKVHFKQIACPPCMGVSSEFDIKAELLLHYPTSGNYFEYMTPVGTCTTNLLETHVSSQPLGANQVALFNGISLNPSGQGAWTNNYVLEHQVQRQTSHNIQTEHGTISNAFTSIEGFDDIQPYTLLWVDPSYAFEAVISKSGTYFSWYPALTGDQFEIIIAVYSSDGSQFLGAVSCMEDDVGSMLVPGTYFQSFPYWSLAAVHLIRHRVDRRPAEELDGYIQSHMIWEVIGTGHIE